MQVINRVKSVLTLTFVGTYLINVFLDIEYMSFLLSSLIILLLIINLPVLKGPNKYISLGLFLIGIVIMINFNADLSQWQQGLNKNAGIVSLLITVPMLSFLLYYENFHEVIVRVTKKRLDTPLEFYTITSLLSYCIGIILNIASMSITYQLLKETKNKYANSLFSSALTRGFTGCSIWSPNFVGVAVILNYLDIPWVKIAPMAFLFSLVAIYSSIKYEQYIGKNNLNAENLIHRQESVAKEREAEQENTKLLRKLLMLGAFLISLIVFGELLTGLSVLVIVPIVAIFLPYLIALFWNKKSIFWKSFANYFNNKVPNMNNEIVLFLAAGFFGQSLNVAQAGNYVIKFIYFLDIQQSMMLITILVAAVVLPALIGVHPVVTASTIAVTLPISTIPLMPIQFALTLLTAYAIAALLSPISATVLVTAGILNESPFSIGLAWNWQYGLILASIYIVFLSVIPF